MMNSSTDFVISLSDKNGTNQFTGNNAIIKSIEVNHINNIEDAIISSNEILKHQTQGTIDVTLEMTCIDTDFLHRIFSSDYNPHRQVSKLRVGDCSIEELLFAVRKKIGKAKPL